MIITEHFGCLAAVTAARIGARSFTWRTKLAILLVFIVGARRIARNADRFEQSSVSDR